MRPGVAGGARSFWLKPDAVHSAQYGTILFEFGDLEAVGCGGAFSLPDGAAVSSGRAAPSMANGVCVVRIGSAAVRDFGQGWNESRVSRAARISAGLFLRLSVVHGQLLLGP